MAVKPILKRGKEVLINEEFHKELLEKKPEIYQKATTSVPVDIDLKKTKDTGKSKKE